MDRLLGIQNVPTTGLSPEAVERVTTVNNALRHAFVFFGVTQTVDDFSYPVLEFYSQESRKEGVFAGLTSGLASVIIGQRLFGFKRNLALVSGVVGGVLSGYIFTQLWKTRPIFLRTIGLTSSDNIVDRLQAFKDTAVRKLHAEEARLRSLPQTTESQPSSESTLS